MNEPNFGLPPFSPDEVILPPPETPNFLLDDMGNFFIDNDGNFFIEDFN